MIDAVIASRACAAIGVLNGTDKMSRKAELDNRPPVSSPITKVPSAKSISRSPKPFRRIHIFRRGSEMKLQYIPLFRSTIFRGLIAMGAVAALALSLCDNVSVAFDGKKDKRGVVEGADLKNFGKVNDHIYRGGQPDESEYKKLAAIGVKTIIDLRERPEGYARRLAEDAGLQYINIGLNDKRAPTE